MLYLLSDGRSFRKAGALQASEWLPIVNCRSTCSSRYSIARPIFVDGRLLALRISRSTAIGTSALLFAFDPFLVATFHQLHWIAVWDGLVWGMLWVTFRNLYVTIVAHAVEVIVLYVVMRIMLA